MGVLNKYCEFLTLFYDIKKLLTFKQENNIFTKLTKKQNIIPKKTLEYF